MFKSKNIMQNAKTNRSVQESNTKNYLQITLLYLLLLQDLMILVLVVVVVVDFGGVVIVVDDDFISRKWPNMPRPYHHIIPKKKFKKGKNVPNIDLPLCNDVTRDRSQDMAPAHINSLSCYSLACISGKSQCGQRNFSKPKNVVE